MNKIAMCRPGSRQESSELCVSMSWDRISVDSWIILCTVDLSHYWQQAALMVFQKMELEVQLFFPLSLSFGAVEVDRSNQSCEFYNGGEDERVEESCWKRCCAGIVVISLYTVVILCRAAGPHQGIHQCCRTHSLALEKPTRQLSLELDEL